MLLEMGSLPLEIKNSSLVVLPENEGTRALDLMSACKVLIVWYGMEKVYLGP